MESSPNDPTPTKANRNSNGRSSVPRRSTRGPLDLSQAPVSTSTSSTSSSQILPSRTSDQHPSFSTYTTAQAYPTKEFAKLLRPEIFHPLTHLTTPAPFRSPLSQVSNETPLEVLLETGHFQAAAISAAQILSTSTSASDHQAIFSLFYTRLACLTLCGSTALAAQEATALEDLNASAYHDEATGAHLVPWELRVLAVRLQGVGFNDPRKGVMEYYDLARQARGEISKLNDDNGADYDAEKERWQLRLHDLGIRVANTLVEMGDLESATHHLKLLSSSASPTQMQNLSVQRAILWLRIGNPEAAQRSLSNVVQNDEIVTALSDMTDGKYRDAVEAWKALSDKHPENGMYKQNLAVCMLYDGRMDEARTILEDLVRKGNGFHALTFNLCTIYELCTDKSRALKLRLAEQVAALPDSDGFGWEKSVLDFKL